LKRAKPITQRKRRGVKKKHRLAAEATQSFPENKEVVALKTRLQQPLARKPKAKKEAFAKARAMDAMKSFTLVTRISTV